MKPKRIATYTRMADGTQSDYLIQRELSNQLGAALANRVQQRASWVAEESSHASIAKGLRTGSE